MAKKKAKRTPIKPVNNFKVTSPDKAMWRVEIDTGKPFNEQTIIVTVHQRSEFAYGNVWVSDGKNIQRYTEEIQYDFISPISLEDMAITFTRLDEIEKISMESLDFSQTMRILIQRCSEVSYTIKRKQTN